MMGVLIELDKVSKQYGGVRALDHVSFTVDAGEWIAIMGPSGSGKTTLINILGGLDSPSSGRVLLDGKDIGPLSEKELTRYRAEKVGFVFQQFHLIPYLTAVENVMLAQYFHSMTDEKEARESLARVGLADRAEHLPSQLSGGEQQRVAVARALANRPRLVLADEPTGNLDSANAEIVAELLFTLQRDTGMTLVLVTHDERLAARCRRCVRMRSAGSATCSAPPPGIPRCSPTSTTT